MDEQTYDHDQDPVFHERPHMLSTKGYRGFEIKNMKKHWDGIKITAANKKGIKISASGDTEKETLKKLIDQIDLLLDQ